MPRVSIIIPTYNRATLLGHTLESVFSQTYTDYEVIVIDDGSTDNTHAILARYEDRICVVHQKNQGVGAARNAGILAGQGDYIAFLDSDDIWMPAKLEHQMAVLREHSEPAWIYSDAYAFESNVADIAYLFSQRCRQYEGYVARELFLCDFIPTLTVVVHRDIWSDVGLFGKGSIAEDWAMWLRIAATYPVCKISAPLAGYRLHGAMASEQAEPMAWHQHNIAAIEEIAASMPLVYGPLRRRAIAAQSIRTGRMLASSGQLVQARAMFVQATRLTPQALDGYLYWLLCLSNGTVVDHIIQLLRRWRTRQAIRREIQ